MRGRKVHGSESPTATPTLRAAKLLKSRFSLKGLFRSFKRSTVDGEGTIGTMRFHFPRSADAINEFLFRATAEKRPPFRFLV